MAIQIRKMQSLMIGGIESASYLFYNEYTNKFILSAVKNNFQFTVTLELERVPYELNRILGIKNFKVEDWFDLKQEKPTKQIPRLNELEDGQVIIDRINE